ncbi:hypothetical protein DPMN_059054 [Dreissena polymorpha]|uniref:Uncharacterized protein n=1 Tax=Dreissena polymorpha TaxID=45954 RepID=A0A9D4C2V5_DREPO|nr:hypothetical protein DPMN_059054 [Dreissena polymorpha]
MLQLRLLLLLMMNRLQTLKNTKELNCSLRPEYIIRTNVLTKFHEDRTKNVTKRALIRINYPIPGGHVFQHQQTGTIFKLAQDIIHRSSRRYPHYQPCTSRPGRESPAEDFHEALSKESPSGMVIVRRWIDRIGELQRAALFIQRVPSSVEPDVFPADIADSQNLKGPQSGMWFTTMLEEGREKRRLQHTGRTGKTLGRDMGQDFEGWHYTNNGSVPGWRYTVSSTSWGIRSEVRVDGW